VTIAKELCIPCGFRRPPSWGGLRGGLRGLRNDIRVALPTLCRLRTAVAMLHLVRGGRGGAAQARRAETAPSLAMPRPTSSIGTRDGCLREGGEFASARKERARATLSLARPRPISSIVTREGCLLAPAETGGRERVSAAAAARAGNAGREASGCENCLLSSHPPPRSWRNLPLLVGCTMVSFYVFLAILGTDPLLSTAPV